MRMIIWFRNEGRVHVMLGALVASALNFYAFVIAPLLFAVEHLEQFVQDSYLSGFYMASAVSSIMPFCVFMYRFGGQTALRRYVQISLVAAVAISICGISIARLPWSYMMIAGALLMHLAGFYLGAMIHRERTALIAMLQCLQPFLFACFITLNHFVVYASVPWSGLYLLSAALAITIFVATARHEQIWSDINLVQQPIDNTFAVLTLIAATVSFPLFFHVELFLIGNFGSIALGEYAILQKLYASVATSLFGSVGLLILNRSFENKTTKMHFLPKEVIGIACLAAVSVPVIGLIIFFLDHSNVLAVPTLTLCSVSSFFYTLCSYCALRLAVIGSSKSLQLVSLSILFYTVIFFGLEPDSSQDYMQLSLVFFIVYLGGARAMFSFQLTPRGQQ